MTAAALSKHSGTPKQIEFYKVASSSDFCFSELKFEREIKGTEANDVFYHTTIRLKDGSITREEIFTITFRIFPLKTTTLLLQLDDHTPYDSVLALLQAIESDQLTVNSNTPATHAGDKTISIPPYRLLEIPRASDLPKVIDVRYNPKEKNFSVLTSSHDGRGKQFYFTNDKGVFICIRSGLVWF